MVNFTMLSLLFFLLLLLFISRLLQYFKEYVNCYLKNVVLNVIAVVCSLFLLFMELNLKVWSGNLLRMDVSGVDKFFEANVNERRRNKNFLFLV